ncbi:MAG: dUTP diphosphatase [Flavobacteriaceae bacterium]|jgi:dUTP pyrophosphatase|nr:dUTP diphosphatase [Flavobacteriaceae bacterium]|tara:strand:- start:739 stop:1176 length:438 start_codon:yes stop_codon:yes gene_type:complete
MLKIPIINQSPYELPSYATVSSAGMDLKAVLTSQVTLKPLERKVVGTGIKIALPEGYEAQVRPRSGLAAKKGITVLNSPGTIDADYRGEIGVILINLSSENYMLNPGERVAQLVISRYEKVSWDLDRDLDNTTRGNKGFGSTGNI